MINKIESFVSVVVVGTEHVKGFQEKIRSMSQLMESKFRYWELIFVDNGCPKEMLDAVESLTCKTTIVKMARKHKMTQALQAGLDCAIGDYVFEFEDYNVDLDWNILIQMYERCQEGYDFVFCHPKQTNMMSRLFYMSLNRYFEKNSNDPYFATSSVCILSSRRGQNRVEGLNKRIVNRSLSYSLSGLKTSYLICDCEYRNRRGTLQNLSLMLDSYIYYTNIIVAVLTTIAMIFLMCSVGMGIYSLISYLIEVVVEGWTSTMLYMSIGFAGMFSILALLSKYLDHILKAAMDDKEYVYTDIAKR